MRAYVGISSAVLFCAALPAFAQITIDWGQQKLTSYPQIVNDPITSQITVSGINDLLYTYDINLIATPRITEDAGSLFNPTGAKPAPPPVPETAACTTSIQNLTAAVAKVKTTFQDFFVCDSAKNKGRSVPLKETVDGWNTQIKPAISTIQTGSDAGSIANVANSCTKAGADTQAGSAAQVTAGTDLAKIQSWQSKIDAVHEAIKTVTLTPDTDYEVDVAEKCNTTTTATLKQSFSPASTTLTLSLGVLLSGINQRTYTNVKNPANTTQNLLSVNDAGWVTPLGVALLNYRIPWSKVQWGHDTAGLALSSGLVVGFGSTDTKASSLGWFGGLTLHLYHRLFMTGGVHIGEFADFPYGLGKGSIVPANYGDLNPVKRYTGHFAFAVTYRTAGFGKSAATPKAPQTTKQ